MTAKDIISPTRSLQVPAPVHNVHRDMPVMDVLPRLLYAPGRSLGVVDDDATLLGVIDSDSLLEGLGRFLAERDDCSTIVIECSPMDFSASLIGHAVEDADAHLVDMVTTPADGGHLHVTLRVRHVDPTMAVHSLERHNFNVIYAYGPGNADASVSAERLAALKAYLDV